MRTQEVHVPVVNKEEVAIQTMQALHQEMANPVFMIIIFDQKPGYGSTARTKKRKDGENTK